ncbi:MAG: hypothetical protein ABDH66_00325 [Bacteroidia bacterium]
MVRHGLQLHPQQEVEAITGAPLPSPAALSPVMVQSAAHHLRPRYRRWPSWQWNGTNWSHHRRRHRRYLGSPNRRHQRPYHL